ncbi:MAG: hypothetical protein M0D54_00900 [Hyphomonadaceae bacterium JAD_PAG50586_4]|nr:MAG: hypothetical protein M0D54_00900 [Hyphomonadaceae bacterium JAD_PAG50586_4]
MSERMNLAAWSSVLGTWVSIAAAGAGGYAALQTYNEEVAKLQDARVVQTFALFEMSNSTERLQARQRVMDAANTDAPLDPHDLWITLDFYDAVQICVDRALCDQDLAVRLFQPYAAPIWGGLSDQIVGGRTASDPNMGAGLQWMASLPTPTPLERTVVQAPVETADETEAEAEPPRIVPDGEEPITE